MLIEKHYNLKDFHNWKFLIFTYYGYNTPLDPNQTYVLATNDYIALGGDGYSVFVEPYKTMYPYDKPLDSIYVTDVLIWCLNQNQGETSTLNGRIIIE